MEMLSDIRSRILQENRSGKILRNIISSFFLKGWSAFVVLIMVPLTLKCLGSYQNGVWLTLSSLLVWIDQMDIGLGNGLRNSLAVCVAHEDYDGARKIVSSTVAMLCCIVVIVLVIFLPFIWTLDIYSFLNVDTAVVPELRLALFDAVILISMTFVMKFVNNVYMGMQLPAVSNLIMSLGQTLALIGTWILYKSDMATFFYVVIVNTASPLVIYAISYPITFFCKFPKLRPSFRYVDFHVAIKLGNLGVKFFWLQIAALIQFFTANILISNLFTPEMVTPYQISYRYMSLMLVFFTVICMPFWNATTDAYARNDLKWIIKADAKMNRLTLLIFLGLFVMTLLSPLVYSIWIGNDCDVPFGMTVMMAIYIFLMIVSMRYSYFLNGVGALRIQLYMTIMAVIFIPTAWLVSSMTHDILYFMLVMCLCNIPGILVNVIQFKKILNGNAKGIWRI